MSCRQPPSVRPVGQLAPVLLVLCLAGACDRREQGVDGDLSPETGLTDPAPQDTPPSDPASGTDTTGPDPEQGAGRPPDDRQP